MPKQSNIAIFVSGSGTNCENIIRYFAQDEHIKVALVVSSRKDAYALVRAQRLGVDTMVVDKTLLADEGYMHQVFDRYGIGYLIMAGVLKMIRHAPRAKQKRASPFISSARGAMVERYYSSRRWPWTPTTIQTAWRLKCMHWSTSTSPVR